VFGKLDFFRADGGIGHSPNKLLSLSSLSRSVAGGSVCATRYVAENAYAPPVDALLQ